LDAHFSGGITSKGDLETPIVTELSHILTHPCAADHVVLIDDARLFVGANDYSTLEGLIALVSSFQPQSECTVEADIIRIHRRAASSTAGRPQSADEASTFRSRW